MKRTSKITGNFPLIKEIENPHALSLAIAQGLLQPDTRSFKMGKCRVLLSPPWQGKGWHISISGSASKRHSYPSWDEVAHIRYELVPDDCVMAMMLPSQEDYINIHEYTFQLMEVPKKLIEY